SPTGVLGVAWRLTQPTADSAAAPAPPQNLPPGSSAFLMSQAPQPYSVRAAVSRDGGATFSAPLQVSSGTSPAPQAGMFGNAGDDYSTIVLDRDIAYVAWADWRPGERQGFFNAINLTEFKAKH